MSLHGIANVKRIGILIAACGKVGTRSSYAWDHCARGFLERERERVWMLVWVYTVVADDGGRMRGTVSAVIVGS